ncbi:hypothetical protein Tco_0335795 [Tanacetum coccineum]
MECTGTWFLLQGLKGEKGWSSGILDQRGSLEAEEMFAKLELTIEARDDVFEARIIVKDNLYGLGQDV